MINQIDWQHWFCQIRIDFLWSPMLSHHESKELHFDWRRYCTVWLALGRKLGTRSEHLVYPAVTQSHHMRQGVGVWEQFLLRSKASGDAWFLLCWHPPPPPPPPPLGFWELSIAFHRTGTFSSLGKKLWMSSVSLRVTVPDTWLQY